MHILATSAHIERRTFLKSAGAAFVAGLTPSANFALDRSEAVLASTYREMNGVFGVAVLSEAGEVLYKHTLPSRGHDVVWHPDGNQFVVFARRPGTFAVALDRSNQHVATDITSPANRHFYGHGSFSLDSRLLYSTENDFDNARGIIGIYDATDNYNRLGEFEAFGVGPHDVEMTSDGKTLLVANGGIETHPDFPRAKLNLASMRPNLAFIDVKDGSLIARYELPETSHKLSIRHLAWSKHGNIWFACQNEGELSEIKPLVGKIDLSSGTISLLDLPDATWATLRGYVGSIACSAHTGHIAITSPRGGAAYVIDPSNGRILNSTKKTDLCGVASSGHKFVFSTGEGGIDDRHYALHWDNHLSGTFPKAE